MSLGGPVGAVAGMWLGDHVGRKPVLVGFSLATIVLGFIYPFAPSEALLSLVGFALVTCVYVMVAVAGRSTCRNCFRPRYACAGPASATPWDG